MHDTITITATLSALDAVSLPNRLRVLAIDHPEVGHELRVIADAVAAGLRGHLDAIMAVAGPDWSHPDRA